MLCTPIKFSVHIIVLCKAVTYLQEVYVQRGKAASAQSQVSGGHEGEDGEGKDAGESGLNGLHPSFALEFAHAQMSDGVGVQLLVLTATRSKTCTKTLYNIRTHVG